MGISVIMSVYRSEKGAYLDRSLQSVWTDQTLKPDEIVLVEDGPLGTELHNVIDRWKKFLGNKLILIVNKENLGLTKSLNKAIRASNGDYLARMDSDDISFPNRFDIQKTFMDNNPSVDVVGGGMQEIDENGEWGAQRLYPQTTDSIRAYIVKASPIAHPTAFIRRRIFNDGFYYDEKYRKNQDLKLWFDLLSENRTLRNTADLVLYFRRTSDTYLKRSSKIALKTEKEIYINGIKKLYGKYSWKVIYPHVRFLVKSLPPGLIKFIYVNLFRKNNS